MRLGFIFIGCVLGVAAQNSGTATSPQQKAATVESVDPKLHADILTLMQLDGAKQRLQSNIKQRIDVGRKAVMQACANCSPAFGDEWAKRMLDRLNVDDFIQLAVHTYEKYLNDDDVKQLIALIKAKKESKPATLSPELKQKLISVMPSIQSEIMGGCVQIASKLGAEIGQEIEKEHPEYLKPSLNSGKK